MPSTRSQNQPTLQFPRRKSSRLGSRPKNSSENAVDVQANPLSPRKSNVGDSLDVSLSPKNSVLKNTSLSERLPLSPRKRTGDENGCNLPASMLGSPPKQRCAPLCSPRKLSFNENTPAFSSPPRPTPSSPKIPLSPISRPSPKRLQETPCTNPIPRAEGKLPVTRLFPVKKSGYQSVKQALHTAVPERLLSREAERAAIVSFLDNHVVAEKPSSLYISGAPGTGKTACLNCVLQEQKSQEVLYTIFEWPYLPNSRVCLIGIANALDLTDRILPRLQAKPHCRPKLLNFPPYSREELNAIVQDRLTQVSGEGVLDAAAVQFCARKVSAVSGDARKALDICRRAVEIVEAADRAKMASEPVASPKVI
ncbi:cell division control protein 6 homolog [Sinocyclocheilus grahami]|uniref:cell division control protein 6 homolog n=1 Tax=Sinocyclocheilus grahami TaxID=75366 RepID=UPI0007AD5172|nr:PREDICTED: cell division control protein 6 homolog [Sinocyclocheilus grahami]